MQQDDVTLAVGDESYPGRLQTPDESTEQGVLILPGAGHGPFGDIFDRAAEAIADAGYTVVRFETWTSSDELEDKGVEDFRDELQAEIEFLRDRGCTDVTLVGKSFGGRIALDFLTDQVERMVLWAPAVPFEDGEARLMDKTAGDIDIPIRILQGDDDEVMPLTDSRSLVNALPQGELVELPGEDHDFQANQDQIVDETLSFLPE
jgi:pimeloyl-ACP methyl ester carboxylesterase